MKTLILSILIGLSFACKADLVLNSTSALVINVDTGDAIFEKNSTTQRPIASVTKLMTAVILLDANVDLNEEITITNEDVQHTMIRKKPTSTSLPIGATLTRAELLHLALMNSQNRAAYALARTYPGGFTAFVEAMNNKAEILGMLSTKYTEPTGLSAGNQSTAEDLSILVKHAETHPLIKDFSTATSFTTSVYFKNKKRPISFNTTNRFVKQQTWNVLLQKTGFTMRAGYCMVMLTSVNNKDTIIILLNANSREMRAADAIKIKFWMENGREPSADEMKNLTPYKKTHKNTKRNKKLLKVRMKQ